MELSEQPAAGAQSSLADVKPKSRVGLLVIHGMGVENEGDTLADIGDPFLTWSAVWLNSRGGKAVTSPTRNNSSPRHYEAQWTLQDKSTIDVTVSEGWWAAEFAGPSAARESSWLPSLVWNVAWRGLLWLGVIAASLIIAVWVLARGASEDIAPSLAISFSIAALFVLFAFLLPPALLLLGRLPYIRSVSTAALKFLVLWVGDVMVYEKSTTQTANAVQKIREDLVWLEQEADHVIVAAHSLGSLLAVDLLISSPGSKVRTLVTFGSAIKILKRRTRKYVHALSESCQHLAWINLYDPFDFISGPIEHHENFPMNLKIDNCRSILTAHGAYPLNTDQFLTVLHHLVRSAADGRNEAETEIIAKLEGADDIQAATKRRNHRWWQGLLLLPAAMVVATSSALLLLKNHYGEFLDHVGRQLPLPNPIAKTLVAAASKQPQAEAWVSLLTGVLIAAVYAWGVRLALLRSEARSDDQLAQQGYLKWGPWLALTIDLFLSAPAVALVIALTWGNPPPENLGRELWFVGIPLLASAVLGAWALTVRGVRKVSTGAKGSAARDPLPGAFDSLKRRRKQ